MNEFDKRHHELQNAVNSVLFHAPKHKFTIDELIEQLKKRLPSDTSSSDIFYATELLKGSVCRLVLDNAFLKIDDDYYQTNEK